jgi:hypothetical protein
MSEQSISDKLEEKIDELVDRLNKQAVSLFKKDPKKAQYIFKVLQELATAKDNINKKKNLIDQYVKLRDKYKYAPEEVLTLLEIKNIPRAKAVGKDIVGFVAGFQGLGIEAIDHHLRSVNYEGVERNPEETGETSITTFMYRTPPFELTKCEYEKNYDEDISKTLGHRYTWLVKLANLKLHIWDNLMNKVEPNRAWKVIAKGEYEKIYGVVVPKAITFVDLSNRCLEIELQKPIFYLKLGSKSIEEEAKGLKSERELFEKIKSIESKSELHGWGIRLDYVYFCYIGRAMSTDPFDKSCPFEACPYRTDESLCGGKKYWSGRYYKRKPYPKIYPLRRMRIVHATGTPNIDEFLPRKIVNVRTYDDQRIYTTWDGVELGAWFMKVNPIIRLYFEYYAKPGYVIPTSTLNLIFDGEWLDKILKDILLKDIELRKALTLKKVLYDALGRYFDYRKLTKTVECLLHQEGYYWDKYVKLLHGDIDEDFMLFIRSLLLHSLEHMLTQYVLLQLVGVDLNFVITRNYPREFPTKVARFPNIVIAENARNGKLGIVDTVAKKIESIGFPAFLQEYITWLKQTLDNHVNLFEQLTERRTQEAGKVLAQAKQHLDPLIYKNLTHINNKVKKFREELEAVAQVIDIALARLVLLAGRRITEDEISKIEEYLDDVLEAQGFPVCWDGCNACVRLERYCNEGSQQILTTSRKLLRAFIEKLDNVLRQGYTESTDKAGEIIEPILFKAKKEVDISSPYISPRYAEKLAEMASKGVKVRVMTWKPKELKEEYAYHKDALDLLEAEAEKQKNLVIKAIEKLHHLKMYAVDRKISITGSANLTESGMYHNVEHVHVKFDNVMVSKDLSDFEELWKA